MMTTFTCTQCGALFKMEHKSKGMIMCGPCKMAWQAEAERIRKKNKREETRSLKKRNKKSQAPSLTDVQKARKEYMDKTGTYVSYGQFVAMMGATK